jgi:hypothetical protein
MNKVNITIISLCCLAFAAGCSGGGGGGSNESEDVSIAYAIKNNSSNTTTNFTLEDDVIIEIILTNNTNDYHVLVDNYPLFLHEVYDSTGLVKLFDSSFGDLLNVFEIGYRLSPGEHSVGITWNCTDSYGNLLSAGSYILDFNGDGVVDQRIIIT